MDPLPMALMAIGLWGFHQLLRYHSLGMCPKLSLAICLRKAMGAALAVGGSLMGCIEQYACFRLIDPLCC